MPLSTSAAGWLGTPCTLHLPATCTQVSFVEIYNDNIQDLLVMSRTTATAGGSSATALTGTKAVGSSSSAAQQAPGAIAIRETPKGEIQLEGVAEVVVGSREEVAAILEAGNACRATAAHK